MAVKPSADDHEAGGRAGRTEELDATEAALLAMLNSCSPGVAVVNIDNGFGAGYLAATINAG